MAEKFIGRFRRGQKQFVAARCSVPKTMQKLQSRGDATIAMSPWLEMFAIRSRRANRGAELERALATILFVDIVRSTEKAARLGDSRWTRGDESLLRRCP